MSCIWNVSCLSCFCISVTIFLYICKSFTLNTPCSFFSFFLTQRSSNIRPGQFGYGRVPFSLPLHRPNRQARHTVNGTEAAEATLAPGLDISEDHTENARKDEDEKGSDGDFGEAERREEEEGTESHVAEELPTTTTTTGNPHRHVERPSHTNTEHGRVRERVPSTRSFSPSSSSSVLSNRRPFDWHSVTAPPPPISPLSNPNLPAVASPFSSPLHRSSAVHRDRELHPGFSPQDPAAGNIYPLQHPHIPHLGVEVDRDGGRGAPQIYRCSGPEKEYRRCFSQVRSRLKYLHINFGKKNNILLLIFWLHTPWIISIIHFSSLVECPLFASALFSLHLYIACSHARFIYMPCVEGRS